MRVAVLALVLVGGCGRLSFDALVGVGGGPGDDASVIDSDSADGGGPVPPGRVLLYPMDDDPVATNIVTNTTQGDIATCATGECPQPTAGVHAGAYHFTGGQWFSINQQSLIGRSPFTVGLWMRPSSIGGLQVPVSKAASVSNTLDIFSLVVDVDLSVHYEWTPDNASQGFTFSPLRLDGGQWHYVAVTWNGAARKLFVDGVLGGTSVDSTTQDSSFLPEVGRDFDGTAPIYYFHGDLDELSIWNRALTEGEVATLPSI